jgi:hypothetical protein
MNTQKKRMRGAFWGLLVAGPLLLPVALAVSPLFLIPLSLWGVIRVQHSWEQRRLAVQKRNDQRGFVLVNAQKRSAQGVLLLNRGNSLDLSHHPQVLNLHGEFILLVFPSGETSRAKESILSMLADSSGPISKPEMIVLTRS